MDSKQVESRLRALSEELRCLVCQNQSLSDSSAELAVDLRNQVKALIEQGKSDAQIKSYLVDRYGDFVLFKPPVQANTWLLWFGPFLLLLLGAIIWRRVQRMGAANQQGGSSAGANGINGINGTNGTNGTIRTEGTEKSAASAPGVSPQIEAARRLLD